MNSVFGAGEGRWFPGQPAAEGEAHGGVGGDDVRLLLAGHVLEVVSAAGVLEGGGADLVRDVRDDLDGV